MPADLSLLEWKKEGGYQVANDESCLYMRESIGSIVSGFIFSCIFGIGGLAYGGYLVTQPTADSKGFGAMVLLIGAVFTAILVSCLRRGRCTRG